MIQLITIIFAQMIVPQAVIGTEIGSKCIACLIIRTASILRLSVIPDIDVPGMPKIAPTVQSILG